MIIPLFDFENEVVKPTIHCHTLPFLSRIMDQFPKDYLEIYKYIFYLTCPDATMNVYYNRPEDQRESEILHDLNPDFDVEHPVILDTIERCRKMYETPTLRMFQGAKKASDRVAKYLAETEITDGKEGTSGTIDKYMKSLEDYRKTCTSMEKALQEEQIKIRGDGYRRYDQSPNYKNLMKDDSTEKDAI